ncbi:hypothetical protein [Microbacterium aureliae]
MLVTVVVVMFVGFVIAATIAASVMFTVRANDGNRDNLDAFVAAESGRDVALATITGSCSITAPLSGTAPTFTATVYLSTDATTTPASSDEAGLTANSCPSETTEWIVINSVGTGPDGSTSEIDAVYRWVKTLEEVPGGTLAYFAGSVGGQKSIYDGDLVVRKGSYNCPNLAVINGDLYVTDGTVTLSTGCEVTGSIYAYGEVESGSQDVKVGEDIWTEIGEVDLANNGTVIGRDIRAGSNVFLTGSGGTTGIVNGEVHSAGSIDVSGGWNVPLAKRFSGAGAPVLVPTLDDVYSMTAWIDLGKDSWGASQEIKTGCVKSPSASALRGVGRLLIDLTQCSGNSVTITVPAVEVNRDVVFVVPAQKTMKVEFAGNITSSLPIESAPQLVFVHEDRNLALVDGEPVPTCESTGPDDLDTKDATTIGARIMIYSPCSIAGSIRSNYFGQFYTAGNTTRFYNGATINCEEMSWVPVFEEISCYIRVEDGGGTTVTVQSLGDRIFQTER